MLELLAVLQARQDWRGEDLAERLGVSERTLRRDIDRLRQLGYPVESSRGLAGGYRLGPGGRMPPLLLNADEAVAAAVGLRIAAGQPITGIAEDAMAALLKVSQLLQPRQRSAVEAVAAAVSGPGGSRDGADAADVELETLTAVARACRDTEQIRFDYRTHEGASGPRQVEPHHVVPRGARWYLVAWDLDRRDWRIFRLDRIGRVLPVGRYFDVREVPAANPAAYVANSIAAIPGRYQVVLIVEAAPDRVQAKVGRWGTVTAEGSAAARIEMTVEDLSWPVMFLAALNADVRHAEPGELRELLHQLSGRFRVPGATP